jgi:predicted NAD/FAD-binding protein
MVSTPAYADSAELDHLGQAMEAHSRRGPLPGHVGLGVIQRPGSDVFPGKDEEKRTMSLTLVAPPQRPLEIAVIGSGIAGMAAAWLLSRNHSVTVYEKDDRPGGHTNTVTISEPGRDIQVDTGFIVYNERNYPNLVALFDHLGVETRPTDMSFSASMDGGGFEYSGSGVAGLLAQPGNLFRPRMWRMLADLRRFYRAAPAALGHGDIDDMTLGDYLRAEGYGDAFVRDHLLPMGAAIWSTPPDDMLDYPLAAFVRFCHNHGLLTVRDRPQWRTVAGGSISYLQRLTADYHHRLRLNTGVRSVRRLLDQVLVEDRQGDVCRYDHVVIAAHADQALALLADADMPEQSLLSRFRYEKNLALLHSDETLMPRSRRAWSSWNFLSRGRGDEQKVSVSYWMNRLQQLPTRRNYFVTLNPLQQPMDGKVLRSFMYEHPVFDRDAIQAQRGLWGLQGRRRTWFCGSYFGHGFHEDGLQSGLAVAEQLGGLARPWRLAQPNGRIHVDTGQAGGSRRERAA